MGQYLMLLHTIRGAFLHFWHPHMVYKQPYMYKNISARTESPALLPGTKQRSIIRHRKALVVLNIDPEYQILRLDKCVARLKNRTHRAIDGISRLTH